MSRSIQYGPVGGREDAPRLLERAMRLVESCVLAGRVGFVSIKLHQRATLTARAHC